MLALLIRLIIFGAIGAAVVYAIRSWRRSLPAKREVDRLDAPQPALLDRSELSKLNALAVRSEHLAEALAIRAKILEAAAAARASFAGEVDTVMRHVAEQVETTERIRDAIAELDGGRLAAELDRAESQRLSAASDETKRLAEGTLDRLVALRDSVEKLKKRCEELDVSTHHIVLEMRAIHLAVLEAASSAGLGNDAAAEIRRKLVATSEDLRRRAAAEDEVSRLLASANARRAAAAQKP